MIVKINSQMLDRSLKRLGIKEEVEAARIIEDFKAIVVKQFGPRVKKLVKPLYLKDQTLHLSVTSSVLAAEIRMHQQKILEDINHNYKKPAVTGFRFLTQ